MNKKIKPLLQTPSQTVGPFFGELIKFGDIKYPFGPYKLKNSYRVIVNCNIFNGKGNVIEDCFLEYCIKNNYGNDKYKFININRVKFNKRRKNYPISLTLNNNISYTDVLIFGRGLLNHLNTRIYFYGNEKKINDDVFLKKLPEQNRFNLVAKYIKTFKGIRYYNHDIYLNGKKETVFFDTKQTSSYDK